MNSIINHKLKAQNLFHNKLQNKIQFILLLCLSYATSAFATINITNINLRGQAHAPLCFAFAEEQLIKDKFCTQSCENNSAQWLISVFDIAKKHQEIRIKNNPNLRQENLALDLLTIGSGQILPYSNLSARASHCTLEKELFFMNRTAFINKKNQKFAEFYMDAYAKYKRNEDPFLNTINSDALKQETQTLSYISAILSDIAKKSVDKYNFLQNIISFTRCDDVIQVPELQIQKAFPQTDIEISTLIRNLLIQKKSVYAGVCGEVLEKETTDSEKCLPHSVILKNINKCTNNNCSYEIQVVDSNFSSPRTQQSDGSVWIPENIIIAAISKLNLEHHKLEAEDKKTIEYKRKDFVANDTASAIKQFVDFANKASIEQAATQVENFIRLVAEPLKNDSDYSIILKNALDEAKSVELKQISDIQKFYPVVEKIKINIENKAKLTNFKLNHSRYNSIFWLD